VIQQRTTTTIVPDLLAAQTLWGQDKKQWPANWRGKLEGLLGDAQGGCSEECPMQDSGVRHGHFRYRLKTLDDCPLDRTFLGALESFAFRDSTGERRYDFSDAPKMKRLKIDQDQIERDRKTGRITSIYLPLLVFGPAKQMKLPHQQRRLLLAITHELTRTSGSSRRDSARIIVGGKKGGQGYPNLEPSQSYVAFNGNASAPRKRLRGYGYRLIGSTGKGWLHKAGYSVPEDAKGRWLAVGRFLKDLDVLAGRFGLVVAAWHQEKAEWKPLADLRVMVKHPDGRRWLNRCVLRIYTAADYLVRWRRHFAEQMGFTSIPGGDVDTSAATAQAPGIPVIRSGLDLDQWMRKEKLTNKQLAEKLQVTEAWVSYQRSGKKAWSKGFQQKLEALQARASRGKREE